MHNPENLDGYSQWAAVEAAVNGVTKLRPTVESLREVSPNSTHPLPSLLTALIHNHHFNIAQRSRQLRPSSSVSNTFPEADVFKWLTLVTPLNTETDVGG